MIHILHLKIVHYFLHVRQKLMMLLLMKQVIIIFHMLRPMYNLTEYNDNYIDTSGSLWPFKKINL